MNTNPIHIKLVESRMCHLLTLLLLLSFMSLSAQTFTYDADGLYYSCDPDTHEAVVIACRNAKTDYVYQQANVFVPATITVSGASIGGGSGYTAGNGSLFRYCCTVCHGKRLQDHHRRKQPDACGA